MQCDKMVRMQNHIEAILAVVGLPSTTRRVVDASLGLVYPTDKQAKQTDVDGGDN